MLENSCESDSQAEVRSTENKKEKVDLTVRTDKRSKTTNRVIENKTLSIKPTEADDNNQKDEKKAQKRAKKKRNTAKM